MELNNAMVRDLALSYLRGKKVAILGYGIEGFEHARFLKENGVKIMVALKEGIESEVWEKNGFEIISLWEAIDEADILQIW